MRQISFRFAALGVAGLLTACGAGDNEPVITRPAATGADNNYPVITGLAATGAAMAGATVTAKCASGPTMTGTTAADGTFTLAMSNAKETPCMLQVSNGTTTLHSIATDTGRTNVTPLSDLAVTKALGSDAAAAFANYDKKKRGIHQGWSRSC